MKDEAEYTLSEETTALLKRRMHGCFLCLWILQDHKKHEKLTGWPTSEVAGSMFPVEGKLAHIKLEKKTKSYRELCEEEPYGGTNFGNA